MRKNMFQQITDEQILAEMNSNQERERRSKTKSGIVVKGIHDVAVRFSANVAVRFQEMRSWGLSLEDEEFRFTGQTV